eukprot:gnl/MRDRNA2_/MRDRNA2_40783_c0_seq2.p1 gnl/MRDRNA2_/MRDRNA2_40783_c0~~gnl/MRDRNA2_/MRDRNA2_40783_c0_seq2.p1  ORF type:complete len:148 (+),score=25.38 gnl/MRDRNA2_/MRDRNA2_40783_c0_seq2:111-554(+)
MAAPVMPDTVWLNIYSFVSGVQLAMLENARCQCAPQHFWKGCVRAEFPKTVSAINTVNSTRGGWIQRWSAERSWKEQYVDLQQEKQKAKRLTEKRAQNSEQQDRGIHLGFIMQNGLPVCTRSISTNYPTQSTLYSRTEALKRYYETG